MTMKKIGKICIFGAVAGLIVIISSSIIILTIIVISCINSILESRNVVPRWAFVNKFGKPVTQKFDEAFEFSEGLACVRLGRKWGCIDQRGTIRIPFQFDHISSFRDGLAVVGIKSPTEVMKYTYIDHSGKMVFPPRFTRAHPFGEGLAAVCLQAEGAFGFIDKSGLFVIPPQFFFAGIFSESLCAVGFSYPVWKKVPLLPIQPKNDSQHEIVLVDTREEAERGLLSADKSNKKCKNECTTKEEPLEENSFHWKFRNRIGFIDKAGKTVIMPSYVTASDFKNGFAIVQKADKHGHRNIFRIDKLGRKVRDGECGEDLCPIQVGHQWGYCDRQGKLIISARFKSAARFSEGLAAVRLENNKCAFINLKGDLVISTKYDYAGDFSEGIVVIALEDKTDWHQSVGRYKRYYGYMDNTGKVIISPRFQTARAFHNGLALVEYWDY